MRTGGCQCGAVRYEVPDEPHALFACHCLECQKQSASAHGISYIVRRSDLRLTRGKPSSWVRAADSGNRLRCWFCPDCGSRLFHESEPAGDDWASVKGGSLDQPVDFAKAVHIWTARKLPGVVIPPGAKQYPGEPPE